jgi:ParB-like chromosome segregation protein Spo0J
VAQIAESITQWGWTVPILLDEAGQIIAGHGRIMAAKSLGLTDAPCMIARGWTTAQKRAYAIADNKLALNSGWDLEALKAEFGELQSLGVDLAPLGFTANEIDLTLAGWDFGADPRQSDGSHLDGITATIKFMVPQADAERAAEACRAALAAAAIVYEE